MGRGLSNIARASIGCQLASCLPGSMPYGNVLRCISLFFERLFFLVSGLGYVLLKGRSPSISWLDDGGVEAPIGFIERDSVLALASISCARSASIERVVKFSAQGNEGNFSICGHIHFHTHSFTQTQKKEKID